MPPSLTVCFVAGDKQVEPTQAVAGNGPGISSEGEGDVIRFSNSVVEEKMKRKKSEKFTYLVAAIMSTFGITSMAVMAVYYRFSWQMEVSYLKLLFVVLVFFLKKSVLWVSNVESNH